MQKCNKKGKEKKKEKKERKTQIIKSKSAHTWTIKPIFMYSFSFPLCIVYVDQ